MFCTKINSLQKNISDKLGLRIEWTNAILVEYIKNEQHLNASQKKHQS